MFLVLSCNCFCQIYWSHVLSWEWKCSWSSADRRCSNYIWVINNSIVYKGATYIRDFTVYEYACGIYTCLCAYTYVCAYGYSYRLIDMRIYVSVSTSACSPLLSAILTLRQYFFISFTLLIVLLYCYVLWCCTFVTGQPLTLIKTMNWTASITNNSSIPRSCGWAS